MQVRSQPLKVVRQPQNPVQSNNLIFLLEEIETTKPNKAVPAKLAIKSLFMFQRINAPSTAPIETINKFL